MKERIENIITGILTGWIINPTRAFYAAGALQIEFAFDEGIPTACTDGERVFFNPTFFEKLSQKELEGVIAHELLHIYFSHIERMANKNPNRWNIATDYVINYILKKSGFVLPEGTLYPDETYFRNSDILSEEEIYHLLPQKPGLPKEGQGKKKSGTGSSNKSGKGIADDDSTDDTDTDTGRIGRIGDIKPGNNPGKVEQIRRAMAGRAAGSIPAGLERFFKPVKPQVNWQEIILSEITTRNDYSWQVADRRFINSGIYLPDLQDEKPPKVFFAIDTSGSISDDELNKSIAEVISAMSAKKIEVEAVGFDTDMYKLNIQNNKITGLRGGGGTDINKVYAHLEDKEVKPDYIIIVTDGWLHIPDKPCKSKFIWLITSGRNIEIPYGRVIHI